VPAPAVIPAPIAYIKVVAVKKLVVGFLVIMILISISSKIRELLGLFRHINSACFTGKRALTGCVLSDRPITLNKLECLNQAFTSRIN
jgi:hypothetical protein